MPAPSRSKVILFKTLDAAHALAAKASLIQAIPHLTEALRNLEFGVPCENCVEFRSILDFVDCAATLTQEAVSWLEKEWPELPTEEVRR